MKVVILFLLKNNNEVLKMKKFYIIFLLILMLSQLSFPQETPNWVDKEDRNKYYPENFYLQGFSSKNITKQENVNEVLKKLSNYAKLNLIESVKVTINGMSELYINEADNNVKQVYKEIIASSATLDIAGLKIETWHNSRKKVAYAFAHANKHDLLTYYKDVVNRKIIMIEQNIEMAGNANVKNDIQFSLKKYRENFPIFRELEEAQSICLALKPGNFFNDDMQINKTLLLKKQVDEGIRKLEKSNVLTLDDVCSFLAYTLNDQVKQINEKIRLVNFTYQDTRMGSEFSLRLTHILQNKLIQDVNYNITTEANLLEEKTTLMLFGTYWEELNDIKIISTLKNIRTGNVLASAHVTLPKLWLDKNDISIKPESFEDAYVRMKYFNKDEIYGGDLNLELWTNKGDKNLVFTKGEKMKIFVRSNKECYLRIIYHLADGSAVLLIDNYYINSDKVNAVYELPYEFECSPPFGIEILQVNAQTEKFSTLQTINKDGYNYIQNELNEILINTRGMKLADHLMRAEQRIIITTLSNTFEEVTK